MPPQKKARVKKAPSGIVVGLISGSDLHARTMEIDIFSLVSSKQNQSLEVSLEDIWIEGFCVQSLPQI